MIADRHRDNDNIETSFGFSQLAMRECGPGWGLGGWGCRCPGVKRAGGHEGEERQQKHMDGFIRGLVSSDGAGGLQKKCTGYRTVSEKKQVFFWGGGGGPTVHSCSN